MVAFIPVSLLAGWVSAATPINILSVFNMGNTIVGAITVLLTSLFALWVITKTRGNWLYATAVVWALVGSIVRQMTGPADPYILLSAIVSLVAICFATGIAMRKK